MSQQSSLMVTPRSLAWPSDLRQVILEGLVIDTLYIDT